MTYYWDPRHEIRELRARVEHAFRCAQQQERTCRPSGSVALPTDLSADADAFYVCLDLPGVTRQQVNVQVERGALIISGEKLVPEPPEGARVVRRRRSYGAFSRIIPLPQEADLGRVSACLRQGQLEVTIPRQAEAPPHRVEITEQ